MLLNIKAWLAKQALVIVILTSAITIGFGAGWAAKAKSVKASQVKQLVEVRKGDSNAIIKAQASDVRVVTKQAASRVVVAKVSEELLRVIPEPAPVAVAEPTAEPIGKGFTAKPIPLCSDGLVSVRDVRLFNIAFAGAANRAAFPGDGESEITSTVTGGSFCANVTQVIDQYHELAEAHNELVDFVTDLQAEQRRRLGIKQ